MDVASFMTEETIKKLHDCFDDFDDDLDGNIELTMLERAIRSYGLNPTKEEMDNVKRDMDKYDLCNFNQFCYFVYHIARYANTREDLVNAFKVFDRDGTGKIKEVYARKIMLNLDHPFVEQQFKKIFDKLEVDNGFIDYNVLVDILLAD